MPNFRRSTWSLIFLLALLAPFGAMLLLSIITPVPTATRPGGGGETQAAYPILGPPAPLVPSRATAPIFAAGDQKTLWVVHPILLDPTGKKLHAFELLQRASNARTWMLVKDGNNNSLFQDFPSGLAALSFGAAMNSRSVAFVFNRAGSVQSYSTTDNKLQANLPPEQKLVATAGSQGGLFALTRGPVSGSGSPGEILELARPSREFSASRPATTSSQPATASRPAEPALVNAYWFVDSHWIILPPLGPASANPSNKTSAPETPAVPPPGALVALAQQGDRLIAMWADPANADTLVLRSLEFKGKLPAWSAPASSRLPEPIAANSRLLPVLLDDNLYLFWPALAPGATTLELHGGRISTDAANPLPPKNMLPPLSLRAAGAGLDPAKDVAAGPAENSIVAVVKTPENTLTTFLFNERGAFLAGPTLVEPQSPHHDVQLAQNIEILLMIIVITLSFWQWRKRAVKVKLPAGMAIARPLTRVFAFIIDMGISYVLVCLLFGLWEDGGYYKLIITAAQAMNFDILFASTPLMVLLGIYLVHVTAGELFFRRSIGKALTGLQIIMADGKAPTVAAIIIRNLIRLPELLLGLLVIYIFLSPNRQRLGDVVGRTLVIAQEPPEEPAEPHGD